MTKPQLDRTGLWRVRFLKANNISLHAFEPVDQGSSLKVVIKTVNVKANQPVHS